MPNKIITKEVKGYMAKINTMQKGSRYERKIATILRKWSGDLWQRRGFGQKGSDLIEPDWFNKWGKIECKKRNDFSLDDYFNAKTFLPIEVFKKYDRPVWFITSKNHGKDLIFITRKAFISLSELFGHYEGRQIAVCDDDEALEVFRLSEFLDWVDAKALKEGCD